MTSISLRIKEPYADSKYVLVTVFAGPDPEHRGSLGTLHATWDEALELERRVKDLDPARTKEEAIEAARLAIHESCGLNITEGTARDGIDAYFRAIRHTDPPRGWFHFGTHVDGLPEGILLEFSDEVDETGLPVWERLTLARREVRPDLQKAIDDLMNAPMDLLEIAVLSLTPTQRDLLRGFLTRVIA